MIRRIPLFILLLLLMLPFFGSAAQSETVLRLPEATIGLNATTSVDVVLTCPASNCIGVDVTVAYDATIIQINEVTPGDFLGDSPRILVSAEESEGTFRFAALSSGSSTRPSEGIIFQIEVTGLALGESELTVTNLSIFRRGGTVQATQEDGVIEVSPSVPDETEATAEAVSGDLPTMILSRRLTLRSGAGSDFTAIGTVEANVELQVLGISADGAWYLVALPDGQQGWLASSRFITITGDIEAIPVVSATVEALPPTEAVPTDIPATSTPEPTKTELPVETVEATDEPTSEANPTAEPTVEVTPTELDVTEEATATVEPTKTESPTDTPEPPTVQPTSTLAPTTPPTATLQPTSTLRTDSDPNASATPTLTNSQEIATSISRPTNTSAPTNTAAPTTTPSPTSLPTEIPTEAPTVTLMPTNTLEPCTIIATTANVAVSVGPNRVVRTTLPVNQPINVTGQQEAEDGSLWWRIEPLNGSTEVDRFWVRQSDVTAQGDCGVVAGADSPEVISGGGGGAQFSSVFRSGQNNISHNFSVGVAGTYNMVCSGSPTYPEFSVGSSRSRGQTTISLNLTPGNYTLTVFATTLNAAGQTIGIASYNCNLTRR